MNPKEYSIDNIKLLETQKAVKRVLKRGDLIYVSDEDFAKIQAILVKNDVLYTSIRDPELQISTLIIV